MEGLQIAANKNIQIAFYLPDNLLPNGSIFHISINVLAVNGGVRDVALRRRNIRLFFGFSAFLLLLLLLITSVVFNSATLWTAACQVPLSLGFSRQEYWSGLPCWPPGDLPDPGIKPRSLVLQAAGRLFTAEPSGKPPSASLLLLLLSHFSRVRLCATP